MFRRELDEIDERLMALLAQRFSICRQVAVYKAETGTPMMQPGRVAEVKAKARDRAINNGLSEEFARDLYEAIISEACRLEVAIIERVKSRIAG
ncbi:MAG: chorismate mutase [Bryobacteraceae bacterium]